MYYLFDSPELDTARTYREQGRKILTGINRHLLDAHRRAYGAGEHVNNFLDRNLDHEARKFMENYVKSRGVKPASDRKTLYMQFAYLRGGHIREVMDNYEDFDGFDFRSKRWHRRRREQQARDVAAAAAQAAAPPMADPSAENINPNIAIPPQPTDSLTASMAQELANPTPNEAHAEILGFELQNYCYDGANGEGKDETMLANIIGGALKIGTDLINQAKNKGGLDWQKFKDTVSKGATETISDIKKVETKSALRENAPLIAGVLIIALIIGSQIGK